MPSPKGRSQSPVVPAEALDERPIDSPSLEVLEALEMQNAVSNLEARLDSLEIDIARQSGGREDDARRITGEMAVMKARVEDALNAFAGTSGELREMTRGIEDRLDEVVRRTVGSEHPSAQVLRVELRAGIDGVMAGVGDVLESVASETRQKIDALGEQMRQISDGMIKIAEHVGRLASLSTRVDELEQAVADSADR